MRILWAACDFLHPTNRGGQIRSLEMLRRLHARHEIHYVALANPDQPEGPSRSSEYCFRAYPVPFRPSEKRSAAFLRDLAAGLVLPSPVVINRWRSAAMRRTVETVLRAHAFDALVCDFLVTAANVPRLDRAVLFQHNVETMIWRRHEEHASGPLRRLYFRLQARRMEFYEGRVCRSAARVIAVSPVDAALMRDMFRIGRVDDIPTGVDIEYFRPPATSPRPADLVFVGSMDYLPNIDGVRYFAAEILPLIRAARPECTFAIVGRTPPPEVVELSRRDPLIRVTGTVDDVRPFLWGASVSVVPLRIGGGTRLKIYESMAAGVPVVSTTPGAEGLEIDPPRDILLADAPRDFADRCLELLAEPATRARQAAAAFANVAARFSWESVAARFEEILREAPRP